MSEVDQLRAGEDREPRDPATEPTPGQLLARLHDLAVADRLRLLAHLIDSERRASNCWLMGHADAVEHGKLMDRAAREFSEQLTWAKADNARLRAKVERLEIEKPDLAEKLASRDGAR